MRRFIPLTVLALACLIAPATASAQLPIPSLNEKAYDALVQQMTARVPVHNPEWVNFAEEDPPQPVKHADRGLPVFGSLITLNPGKDDSLIVPCEGCELD